jgi:hypothetical protein
LASNQVVGSSNLSGRATHTDTGKFVPELVFNPKASIQIEKFDDRHFCLVMDDAVLEPDRLVQFSIDQRNDFGAVDFSFYPGIYLMAPDESAANMAEFFQWRVRRHFDSRRVVDLILRYSMVTVPPEKLRPIQWVCHRDDVGLEAGLSMQASVLYLFRDPRLGGTSFYVPTRPKAEIDALFIDTRTMTAEAFAAKYGMAAGYMRAGNDYFRRIGGVAAKWNRLIFYDGGMFHSSDNPAAETLSSDPLTGRLTLNGFFTSRRNLA